MIVLILRGAEINMWSFHDVWWWSSKLPGHMSWVITSLSHSLSLRISGMYKLKVSAVIIKMFVKSKISAYTYVYVIAEHSHMHQCRCIGHHPQILMCYNCDLYCGYNRLANRLAQNKVFESPTYFVRLIHLVFWMASEYVLADMSPHPATNSTRQVVYRIVGNFRGVKFSWFSWICLDPWKINSAKF